MKLYSTASPSVSLPAPLLAVLPAQLAEAVCHCGSTTLEEIRIRAKRYTEVIGNGRHYSTGVILDDTQVREILQRMCGGSLYAFSRTINQGYIAMPGGIRVGVCGTAAIEDEKIIGVNAVTSLVVRIPHRVRIDPTPVAPPKDS